MNNEEAVKYLMELLSSESQGNVSCTRQALYLAINSLLNNIPVIHCKDCAYFKQMSIYGHGLCDVHCNGAGEPEVVSETYYCCWADRKEE